jgi:hypothetical protein
MAATLALPKTTLAVYILIMRHPETDGDPIVREAIKLLGRDK